MKKEDETREIVYNFINCFLAGLLVFLGALSSGSITKAGVMTAFIASALTFVMAFKDYWAKETKEKTNKVKLLTFVK